MLYKNSHLLYSYQKEGVNFLRSHKRCILADDMGLGKTAQSLNALGNKGIIICPAGLKYNWAKECRFWRPDLTPIIMSGRNNLLLPSDGQLVITNTEILPDWLMPPPHKCGFSAKDKSLKAKSARLQSQKAKARFKATLAANEKHLQFTTIILDEAHKVKSPDSQRSKKFHHLSSIAQRTWLLTGTPMKKGDPLSLWGMLWASHLQKELFGDERTFMSEAGMRWDKRFKKHCQIREPKASVHERLSKRMLRRAKSEVLPQFPPKRSSWLEIELYDKEVRKQLDLLGSKLDYSGYDLPALENFSHVREALAVARIPAMMEYIERCEEEGVRLLVFSSSRKPIEALRFRKGWASMTGAMSHKKREQLHMEQDKYDKGIALTIGAGGVGFNFTSFSHVLFVTLDWDIGANEQAEDRAWRIGQENKVEIVKMVTDHKVDQHISKLLTKARENNDAIIEGK